MAATAMFGAGAASMTFMGITMGAAIGMGISMIGMSLINSLIAPSISPQALGGAVSSFDSSPSYAWNPASTQEPGGPLTRCYGTMKLYGNIIGGRITESGVNGANQTAYMLLDLGLGPYSALYDFQLNDQAASAFISTTLEFRLGNLDQTLLPDFSDTSTTHAIGSKIVKGSPVVRESVGYNYNALDVVLTFPSGLFYSNDAGGLDARTVNIVLELSGDGGASWATVGGDNAAHYTFSVATQRPIRRTIRIPNLTDGIQYKIRVSNLSDDSVSNRVQDDCYLAELNEISYEDFTYPRSVLVAIRALATDQIAGNIRFSCVAEGALIRLWDGVIWSVGFSNNPAWVCYDIVTQPVFDNGFNVVRYDGLDPSGTDLPAFLAWAQWCDDLVPLSANATEKRCTFDGVYDTQTNMWSAALDVAASARATLVIRGTQISPIHDHARTSPAQLFSVGNTHISSFKEVFLPLGDRADCVEVDFINQAALYTRDKLTVVNSSAGNDSTKKITIALRGVTRASQAYREARYRLAKNEYITRVAEIEVDIDSLACTVGDLVLVQSDVTLWGVGGRAVSGTSTSIELDQKINLGAGVNTIQIRLYDDTVVTRTITTPAGVVSSVTFTPPIEGSYSDNQGLLTVSQYDPWAIGAQDRVTKEFLITDISRAGEQTASLSLIEYNTSIYADF